MPSTPKSSTALAMSDTRLQRRDTKSLMISIVSGWDCSPIRVFSTATLSSTGRDGSVRARSSWMLWSSTLVIVNSSFPIRHASSPEPRSLGASESRETRSAMRDASPRIGHLPFLKVFNHFLSLSMSAIIRSIIDDCTSSFSSLLPRILPASAVASTPTSPFRLTSACCC